MARSGKELEKDGAGLRNVVTCIVCRGIALPRFIKQTGNLKVNYCQCERCGHLTAIGLESNTEYSSPEYFSEVDYGWKSRNKKVLHVLKFFKRVPGLGVEDRSTILDYGCGKGLLVRALVEAGFNAYGYEPYVISFETVRVFRDFSSVRLMLRKADLVTLIEVLEHVQDPLSLLREVKDILHPQGHLFVSTGIFEPHFHDESWYYLNPEAGHVSIFTEHSLILLLKTCGFHPVFRVNETMWLFAQELNRRRSLWRRVLFSISSLRVRLKPTNLRSHLSHLM